MIKVGFLFSSLNSHIIHPLELKFYADSNYEVNFIHSSFKFSGKSILIKKCYYILSYAKYLTQLTSNHFFDIFFGISA